MSRIKGKDTKPETTLRKALWRKGLRYRLHYKIPGRPDLVFVGARIAVFVDGCFWHGCPDHSVQPKSNADFWKKKLATNMERDKQINAKLSGLGWKVIRIWEHEVSSELDAVVRRIEKAYHRSALPKKGS